MIKKKLLLLPGDGIGKEVVAQAQVVLDWFIEYLHTPIEYSQGLIGGASIDAMGTPLSDEVFKLACDSDAILLGCVGGPKWDSNEWEMRPGYGLLKLRKELELFANLRPIQAQAQLSNQSTLKADEIEGVDLLIVRELTGGIYFGQPRGIERLADGQRRGYNTQTYSTSEIERVGRVAFEQARVRNSRVCSVDKANVLEASEVWRDEITRLHAEEYHDVELSHMYVDNCAMQLIRNPRQFDVIVTDNMFGDILSDCAAMITGSLGLLPSASIGKGGAEHRCKGMYEPVHGSAPDIAGMGISNPYGTLFSLEMLLRITLGMQREADMLRSAISECLKSRVLTRDLVKTGENSVPTNTIGQEVVRRLAQMQLGVVSTK